MSRYVAIMGVIATLICVDVARAEVLVNWNLDGLSRSHGAAIEGEPTFVRDGVTVSDLTFSAAFKATTWLDALTVYANDLASDLSGAIAKDAYFTFTLTPDPGKKISFSKIFNRVSVNTGDLNSGATIELVLLSSADGFTADNKLGSFTASHPSDDPNATESSGTFKLSGAQSLQNVSGPVEFRIYAILVKGVSNRLGYGHIFYQDAQDDLRVEGTISELVNIGDGE